MSAQGHSATCVAVGEAGILIQGASGSGKSRLARDLIAEAQRSGRFARLVGDDRVRVSARNGRLVATRVPSTAGQIEARGLGILTVPYEGSAIVRLIVDLLAEEQPRLPSPGDRTAVICGVPLPRLGARFEPGLSGIILWRLDNHGDILMTDP